MQSTFTGKGLFSEVEELNFLNEKHLYVHRCWLLNEGEGVDVNLRIFLRDNLTFFYGKARHKLSFEAAFLFVLKIRLEATLKIVTFLRSCNMSSLVTTKITTL